MVHPTFAPNRNLARDNANEHEYEQQADCQNLYFRFHLRLPTQLLAVANLFEHFRELVAAWICLSDNPRSEYQRFLA